MTNDVHTCYRDLDDIEDRGKRLELALRGVFAGNVFDLGAQGTADMFENGEVRNDYNKYYYYYNDYNNNSSGSSSSIAFQLMMS